MMRRLKTKPNENKKKKDEMVQILYKVEWLVGGNIDSKKKKQKKKKKGLLA